MVDVWLIVTAVILSVLLLIISAFILVYFGHPDDKNEAYVPKIVVVSVITYWERHGGKGECEADCGRKESVCLLFVLLMISPLLHLLYRPLLSLSRSSSL